MARTIICHLNVDAMKRKRYCCDASRQMYEDYYTGQVGGSMPVFRGARYQRGHGLGNVIGGLFRRVVLPFLRTSTKGLVPFLKKNKKTFIRNALRTGMEVADDVLEGESLKSSMKKRIPKGIKRTADDVDWQTGSGFRKRRRRKRKRDALS